MRANVLADLGRFDEAIGQYRALLAAHPGAVAAHQALAGLLPQLGRGGEALDAFAAALPDSRDPAMWRAAIAAAQAADDGPRMQAWAADAARRFGDGPDWAEALATGLMLAGDRGEAIRVALAAPPSPGIRYRRAWLALAAGDLALAETEALAVQDMLPDNQWGWSLLSVIWRLTDDPREAWLIDYEHMITARDLMVPPGWPDLAAFIADLAPNLTARHKVLAAPADQSLRGGTQTRGDLFDSPDPLIIALREAVRATIRGWLAELAPLPGHPFLGRLARHAANAGDVRFAGSWSVRLRRDGFHIHHVHPKGWLSSALYIAIPAGVADPGRRDGKLAFGVPETRLGIDLPPRRLVVPAPGRLALFPSYVWHGTLPFAADGVRMTVAFDALPG